MVFFSKEGEQSEKKSNENNVHISCFHSDEKFPPMFNQNYLKGEQKNLALRLKQRCLTLGSINSITLGPDNKLYDLLDEQVINQSQNSGEVFFPFNSNVIEYDTPFMPQSIIKKKVSCNCKKSKCLKLYCDCFAQGETCRPDCNCSGCKNTEDYVDERDKARKQLTNRNPTAFQPKLEVKEDEDIEVVLHTKGCNCKKSNCLKKYCECYNNGIKCAETCKCVQCKNRDSKYIQNARGVQSISPIKKEENEKSFIEHIQSIKKSPHGIKLQEPDNPLMTEDQNYNFKMEDPYYNPFCKSDVYRQQKPMEMKSFNSFQQNGFDFGISQSNSRFNMKLEHEDNKYKNPYYKQEIDENSKGSIINPVSDEIYLVRKATGQLEFKEKSQQ